MLKKVFVFAFAAAMAVLPCSGRQVVLQDYLDADPYSENDAMSAIRAALAECARTRASELILPGGTLQIKGDFATERYEFISNNDPSLKNIAFFLEGVKNFTVKGNGTTLMFHGYVSPFSLIGCKNVKVEDLSIDFTEPFVHEGIITGYGPDYVDLRFPSYYNPRLKGTNLCFVGPDGEKYSFASLLEFDTVKKEVAYHVHDYWVWSSSPVVTTQNADGTYRLRLGKYDGGTIGNTMALGSPARLHPAFTLLDCENFVLEDVNIWQCDGMGVIAQSSRDITLERVKVEPTPGSDHVISISADATHFVNCKGQIVMRDCVFKNQKDDATNVHGWYMQVDKVLGPRTMRVCWRNSGQFGVAFIKKGMYLELVDYKTMNTYARMKVRSVNYLNSLYADVTFCQDLPEGVEQGNVVAEDGEYPDVLITGCYIGNNRARGLLIGSRGKVVIEKNTFHSPGTAILFEGDGHYWYEQSGVRDVVIRDNVFDNCMYGSPTWGSACIAVGSGIPERENSRYHKNILVENNVFRGFDNRIVNLYCVDGFVFRNNTIEKSDEYPAFGDPEKMFIEKNCDNIIFE